jgi:hypothetical protein
MLAGEAGIQWLKGHSNLVQTVLHEKSFALRQAEAPSKNSDGA